MNHKYKSLKYKTKKNIGMNICDLGLGSGFFGIMVNIQLNKKINFINIKNIWFKENEMIQNGRKYLQ